MDMIGVTGDKGSDSGDKAGTGSMDLHWYRSTRYHFGFYDDLHNKKHSLVHTTTFIHNYVWFCI